MRKEKILHKIQDALGITDAETSYAVKELLEKIQEKLEYGSAIKIPKIGMFILTKLRNPDFIYAEEEPVLLYNDPYDYEFNDAYGAINLPETAGETLLDKSFSISVNKPIAPILERDALAGHTFIVVQKILESKINGLLELSEKIKNYETDKRAQIYKIDLYQDDDIKVKSENTGLAAVEEDTVLKEIPYTAPKIHEEVKEEDIAESASWGPEEDTEHITEEAQRGESPDNSDYMEFEWNFEENINKDILDETQNELIQNNIDNNEDAAEVITPAEPEITIQIDEEPVIKNEPEIVILAAEKVEETIDSHAQSNSEKNIVEEFMEEPSIEEPAGINEDVILEEPDIIKEEVAIDEPEVSKVEAKIDEPEVIKEEVPIEEPVVIENEAPIEAAIETEAAHMVKDKQKIKGSDKTPYKYEDLFMEEEESKRRLSPAFWFILILMFIFTGAGLYYFFVEPSNTKTAETAGVKIDPENTNQAAASGNSRQAPVESETGAAKTPSADANKTPNNASAVKTQEAAGANKIQTGKAAAQTPANQQRQQSASGTPQVIEDPADKLISDDIYYNGKKYSVQISSWKSRNIALTEADKLLKSGYKNTYVLKAFVPKFNSTYYRVRIGGFNTADEARKFTRSY